MNRVVRGLLALMVLAAILVGAPWLLWRLVQTPGFLLTGFRLSQLFTTPDDGRLFLVLVWAAACLLWAWMVVLILVELGAAIRGVHAPRLPAAALPQRWARGLVLAALALFLTTAPLPTAAAAGGDGDAGTRLAPNQAGVTHVGRPMTRGTDIPQETVEVDAAARVSVERGDTLWALAKEHLGDPLRWPEIYERNHGIVQPDGASLQDPDLIHVGWSLGLPQTETSPPEPLAPHPEPASVASDVPAGTTPTHGPDPQEQRGDAVPPPAITGGEGGKPTRDSVPDREPVQPGSVDAGKAPDADSAGAVGDDAEDLEGELVAQWWHVSGLLGSGLLLGVGVAAVLLRRRREQFRTRRPGSAIVAPPPVVVPIERTAQLASGLMARQATRLDQVLRRLGAERWPTVEAVVMARDATITLRTREPLASPWEQDEEGWVLSNSVPLEVVGEPVQDQQCPYPLLVTIGVDDRDRVWLVNLAAIGILQVAGDPVMRADFLRYVAAELAVNPWSEGVRVACHGIATEVVAMSPARLAASIDEVTIFARTNAERSAALDTNAVEGRAGQLGDEAWGAAAVLADVELERIEDLAELIVEHPQSTGTALITLAERGALTVTASGRIQGFGLDLTAVGLTEDEAAGCAALLAAAEAEDQCEPWPVDDYVDATGNLRPEHRLERSDDAAETVASVLPSADADYLGTAVVDEGDLDALAPRLAAPVAEMLTDRDPELDEHVAQWFCDVAPRPRLALLGPVTARCLGKPIAKQKGYFTELLAYLALHPGGVTTDQVAEAFSISPERARTAISQCRQWAGYDATTREPFIPDARANPQARSRGIGVYLVDCLVDVDLFRRLRTRGIARGPAGIEDLELALSLVTGRPFDQLRPGGWSWLAAGDRIDQHMVCAISDVAHLVVVHHCQQGHFDAAREAARIGLAANPESEAARLDLAGIMIEEGHAEAAGRVVAETLGGHADLDLSERGAAIINGKGWLKHH